MSEEYRRTVRHRVNNVAVSLRLLLGWPELCSNMKRIDKIGRSVEDMLELRLRKMAIAVNISFIQNFFDDHLRE